MKREKREGEESFCNAFLFTFINNDYNHIFSSPSLSLKSGGINGREDRERMENVDLSGRRKIN